MSCAITLNDAYELLKRKLLINKMSLSSLEAQMIYSKEACILQVLTMKDAEKKIKLVIELNEITENQLNDFTQERQDRCQELYHEINVIDTPTKKFLDTVKRLDEYQQTMLNLMPKIQYLESMMPSQQLVTNFHIKPKKEPTTSFSCATDALALGVEPHQDTM
jgi:hypothetical protein